MNLKDEGQKVYPDMIKNFYCSVLCQQ